MPRFQLAAIPLILFVPAVFPASRPPAPIESSDPGGVLRQLTLANFGGDGQTTITALQTDSAGNIYIAGTTGPLNLPFKNAEQQQLAGEPRIMMTTDYGSSWQPVGTPPADVTAVAVAPSNAQIVLASGGSGIYKSTDGGKTWREVYGFNQGGTPYPGSIVIDPLNPSYIAANAPNSGALLRSLDGGETWAATGQNPSGQMASQVFADPGGVLMAVFGASTLLSRDWGATFQPLTLPGQGGLPAPAVAFDPSNAGWIYLDRGQPGPDSTFWLSMDYGATWTRKASPSDTSSAMSHVLVDPSQPNVIVGATADSLWVSQDGAATWTRVSGGISQNVPSPLAFPRHGCASTGGLFELGAFSPDLGATWNSANVTAVTSVNQGPGCSMYVTRTVTADAFAAKLAPDGTVIWAAYQPGAVAALALDGQGNLYLAGNTSSPDFPATLPPIGPSTSTQSFVTRFSPSGAIVWSVEIGGGTAAAIAVDSSQNVYLAGSATSSAFPVTAGALDNASANGPNGFLLKLAPSGSLAYAALLGGAAGSVLVDAAGEAIVAGNGVLPGFIPPQQYETPAYVIKLNSSGSQVLVETYISGSQQDVGTPDLPLPNAPVSLAQDASGNLFVFGGTGVDVPVTSAAYNAPQALARCTEYYGGDGNAFIAKLAVADWSPVYRAMLRAACGILPGAIAVEPDGSVVMAMAAGVSLPLHNPLIAGPPCSYDSSAVAKLSPDGSALQFATYLDDCRVPAMALAPDGSIALGVQSASFTGPAGVLRLPLPAAPPITLDGIVNAFSGDGSAMVTGGLYTITGTGFQPAPANLGLAPGENLPAELNGVQVVFDGIAAPVLSVAPGNLIVAAPAPPPARLREGAAAGFTPVQITWNGLRSNQVWMPVATSKPIPGLMTKNFPALSPLPAASLDAYAFNQDGTPNSETNPAHAGTNLYLYATGLGATTPPLPPGTVSQTEVSPAIPVWSTWDLLTSRPDMPPPPLTVTTMNGFVSDIFQVQLPVPPGIVQFGTPDSNGVVRYPVGLLFYLNYDNVAMPVSNWVNVYLQ